MNKLQKKYCPNFKKLKIVFKNNIRQNWVGDWDLKTNTIMISNKLNDTDKFGVIIHEFIEMMITTMFGIPDCCDNKYKQGIHGKINLAAHSIANNIEKKILELGNYSWEAHEKRIVKVKKELKNEKE